MAGSEFSPSRIGALVRLLADDDERIRRIARENLIAAGGRALSIVEESARGAEDPQVRVAAKRFLKEAQWDAGEVIVHCRVIFVTRL